MPCITLKLLLSVKHTEICPRTLWHHTVILTHALLCVQISVAQVEQNVKDQTKQHKTLKGRNS